MSWEMTNRADPAARKIADRHYNRQKIGSPQFVPPGRCVVLIDRAQPALWVTSWPYPEYVMHAWKGAWVNSLFRKEGHGQQASDLIRAGVAATRAVWQPPALGIVSFVDPEKVPGVVVRGKRIFGFAYWRAGWRHVGYTKGGLWVWQQLPGFMPPPAVPQKMQGRLFA
jgi:hypothetical protein